MNELDQEKLFYERFYSLHNDPWLMRLYERFGIALFRRSSVLEGFDAFLQRYYFKGKCCLEIGTCNGLTAAVLSRYFEKVISIDVVPVPVKHEVLKVLGITNVRFIDVANNERKADVVKDLEFDAAYVDGDHAKDTYSDFALVRGCGRVLFHEYWAAQSPVWNLVNSLPPASVRSEGKFALWTD